MSVAGTGTRTNIHALIARVRGLVLEVAPELLSIFDIYAQEAIFARALFAPQLDTLPGAACVLEIGAGMMLLSCQLQSEGLQVTAVEPVGPGFSHFHRLQSIVLSFAKSEGCLPRIVPVAAEELRLSDEFQFAYSTNVMEHVAEVHKVIERVVASLRVGGTYRFTCPNYLFPYEPHFNIPTLFSKHATEKWLGRRIFSSERVTDAEGTWRSLNWVTVPQIRAAVRSLPNATVSFDRRLLSATLERIVHDQAFSQRRSIWLRDLIGYLVKLRLHMTANWIPALLQPIIDCTIVRTS
jgi:2-polyprenyl-3-methyl-5-hydroxy-6-metoxy-1,4-benzoquinol methylase